MDLQVAGPLTQGCAAEVSEGPLVKTEVEGLFEVIFLPPRELISCLDILKSFQAERVYP